MPSPKMWRPSPARTAGGFAWRESGLGDGLGDIWGDIRAKGRDLLRGRRWTLAG